MAAFTSKEVMMDTVKSKFILKEGLVYFFIGLFLLAVFTNSSRGVNADIWVIPLLMALFGLIGAAIGSVPGLVVGLAGMAFGKEILIPGLKYGAAAGFVGMLAFWFLLCWLRGTAVCIARTVILNVRPSSRMTAVAAE